MEKAAGHYKLPFKVVDECLKTPTIPDNNTFSYLWMAESIFRGLIGTKFAGGTANRSVSCYFAFRKPGALAAGVIPERWERGRTKVKDASFTGR